MLAVALASHVAAFPPLVHAAAVWVVVIIGSAVVGILCGLAAELVLRRFKWPVAALMLLFMVAAAVLAWDFAHSAPVTLSMTLPAYRANVQHSGELPSVKCVASAERLSRVTGVRAWGRRQAPAWLILRWLVDVQGWPEDALWGEVWPQVTLQAADSLLVSVAYPDSVSWRLPGTRVAYIIPDAKWSTYSVSVADSAGWSCWTRRSRP